MTDISELVGFRSIERFSGAADAALSPSHQRLADLVDGFVARRAAILDRECLDAERWLDDDRRAGAVALPPPQTYL